MIERFVLSGYLSTPSLPRRLIVDVRSSFCVVSDRNFIRSVERTTTTMKAKVAGEAGEVVAAVVAIAAVAVVVEAGSEAVAAETQEEGKAFACELYTACRQTICVKKNNRFDRPMLINITCCIDHASLGDRE